MKRPLPAGVVGPTDSPVALSVWARAEIVVWRERGQMARWLFCMLSAAMLGCQATPAASKTPTEIENEAWEAFVRTIENKIASNCQREIEEEEAQTGFIPYRGALKHPEEMRPSDREKPEFKDALDRRAIAIERRKDCERRVWRELGPQVDTWGHACVKCATVDACVDTLSVVRYRLASNPPRAKLSRLQPGCH